MRPQQQVKMVCHQAKPRQPHRHFLVSLPHETHKRGEVIIRVKDVTAPITPVQDMVKKPPRDALDVCGIEAASPLPNPM